MSTPLDICRRLAARLAPWLAVIAVAGCLTGGAHHHADGRSHEQCAVCCHGTAPAVVATAIAIPSASVTRVGRRASPAAPSPRFRSCRATLSRAPPQA